MFKIRYFAGRSRPDVMRAYSDTECAEKIANIQAAYYGQPLRIVASFGGKIVFTSEVR